MHRACGCSIPSLQHVAKYVVRHPLLGALLCGGEVVLHRPVNLIVRDASSAVGYPKSRPDIVHHNEIDNRMNQPTYLMI